MSILHAGIDAFNQYMDSGLAEKPDVTWRTAGRPSKANPGGEDEKFWRASAPIWLKSYMDWRITNRHLSIWHTEEGVPAIELSFMVPIPGTDRMFRGFIDRIFRDTDTGFLHIVDLKSGKNPQPSALQLGMYAMAAKAMWDVDIRYGSYYDARKGGLDATYDLNQFSHDLVARWLRNMDRSVKLRDFTPNISRDCESFCDVKDSCYVWNPEVPRPDMDSDLEGL